MPITRSTARFCPTCKHALTSQFSLDISRETSKFFKDVAPAMLLLTTTVGVFGSGMLSILLGSLAGYVFMLLYAFSAFTLSKAAVSSFANSHRRMNGPGWKRPVQRLFLLLSCGLLLIAMFVTTVPAWRILTADHRPDTYSNQAPTARPDVIEQTANAKRLN